MSVTYRLGVNHLYPGEKLPPGDRRWGRYTHSFHTETYDIESFMRLVASGYAYSPEMKNSHRAKPNFLSGQHLVLDYDEGDETSSLETLLADPFIREHAAFLYSTPQEPRSRVVFVLSEPVTDMDTFDRLAKAMVTKFPTSDQTVGEASRFLYGANPTTGVIVYLGNVLDLSVAKSLLPAQSPPSSGAAPAPKRTGPYYPTNLHRQYTVLEIIQEYAPRPSRENNNPRSRWTLRCPLCTIYVEEETNSFTVNEDNDLWRCFACDQSGNAIKLLRLLGGIPDTAPWTPRISDDDDPTQQMPVPGELAPQESMSPEERRAWEAARARIQGEVAYDLGLTPDEFKVILHQQCQRDKSGYRPWDQDCREIHRRERLRMAEEEDPERARSWPASVVSTGISTSPKSSGPAMQTFSLTRKPIPG